MGGNILLPLRKAQSLKRYKEFCQLKKLSQQNKTEISIGKISQKYFWVNNIEHKGNLFDVIELYETRKNKETRFVWLTNFKVAKNNIIKIAKGGRLRWKIENEGFNVQKNRGFNLEHPYSQNEISMKNYYLLLPYCLYNLPAHGQREPAKRQNR
jgi:hypothetical protein